MTGRKGELTRATIDREWPHQVALPADRVKGVNNAVIHEAICAFVVLAVLTRSRVRTRKRIETIETRLSKMQSEIATVLQVQAALIAKLNANSKVEVDPRRAAVEMTDGDIVGQSTSPATPPSQPDSEKSATPTG